jgi:hypothetical protein
MHLPRLFTHRIKFAAALLAAAVLAGCTTPPPPKPAMVPLGQTGDFGYSERDLGGDRVEIVYTGAAVKVPSTANRNSAQVQAELAKTHDLAVWRAAQVAKDRGMAAFKIERETRDTDIEVSQYYAPMSSPLGYRPYWGPYGYYGGYRSWYYDDPFYYRPVRRGAGRVTTTLTVLLFKTHNAADAEQLSTADTLTKLQAERAGAVY